MIYLCKTDGEILGALPGLKKDTAQLTKNITDLWELTFDVNRYENDNNTLVQTDYYDSIDEKMWLYQDDENVYYIIDSEPTTSLDGKQEIKSITAHSCEVELNKKFLSNLKVNMGTKDSLEYLAVHKDEDGTDIFYNINPDGTIKEFIPLINYADPQLSLLHLVLENTDWTVSDDIDEELCKEKYSFESNDNVYTFLMNTLSSTAKVIIQFDRKNKKVGLVKGEKYGEDTGIFIGMRNLLKSVNVSSSNEEELTTVIYPKGNNDLGIEYVNFGQNSLMNLDYFMNEKNEYDDYKFVSEELSNKYNFWVNYREKEIVDFNKYSYEKKYTEEENGIKVNKTKTVHQGSRRELYSAMTRKYNQLQLHKNEIHNKLPNDGVQIDYTKWSFEELDLSRIAYHNALDALISIYKEEYGVLDIGEAPDYTPVPSDKTNIKDTVYWIDFYCYQEIINKVEEALKMYVTTDEYGNILDYKELPNGNKIYYSNPDILKEIDSWKYELSLYGLDELESKRKAWSEKANILFNEVFVVGKDENGNDIYREPTKNEWDKLTTVQQEQFTSANNFIIQLNAFLDYMSYSVRNNSLLGKECKGIVRQCDDIIAKYTDELAEIDIELDIVKKERDDFANSVYLENFKVGNSDKPYFSKTDLSVIKKFIKEANYENNNYLITRLDDIVTYVDREEELYIDAYNHLYEISQPQYNFETSLANLLSIKDFEDYTDDFKLGNFIRINKDLYGENYIKLRLISIQYNPIIQSNEITVKFSTMTKTLEGVNDLAFIFKQMSNSSGGSSSSNSSTSGGSNELGKNDADINIANNMLNALLKTERFGTQVNDIILDSIRTNKADFARLFANSGLFNELEVKGNAIIGGKLQSLNYGTNDENGNPLGSMIDLTNGDIDFIGGLLKYSKDGGLKITGYPTHTELQSGSTIINGNSIQTGVIKSTNYNGDLSSNLLGNTEGSIINLSNGEFNFAGGNLKYTSSGGLVVNGYATTNGLATGTTTINGQCITTGIIRSNNNYSSINLEDGTFSFGNGSLTWNEEKKLSVSGSINSTDGFIGGWNLYNNCLYNGNNILGSKNSIVLSPNGLSYKDFFKVNDAGVIIQNPNYVQRNFTNFIRFRTSRTDGTLGWTTIDTWEPQNLTYYVKPGKVVLWFNDNVANGTYYKFYAAAIQTRIEDGKRAKHYLESYYNRPYIDGYYVASTGVVFPISYTSPFRPDPNNKSIPSVPLVPFTDINNRVDGIELVYFTEWYGLQIKKVEFYDNDNVCYRVEENHNVSFDTSSITKYPMSINTAKGELNYSYYSLSPYSFTSYSRNFCFKLYEDEYNPDSGISYNRPSVELSTSKFLHSGVFKNVSSVGQHVLIQSYGEFVTQSSSSKRYKNSITNNLSTQSLNPQHLYDIDICEFKYNDDYLSQSDQRYNQTFIGFIAEDIYNKYPFACNLNSKGQPEAPNYDLMIAPMLSLIQDQHKDIENIKHELQELKEEKVNGKTN